MGNTFSSHNRQLSRKNKFLFDRRICAYEGIIKPRPGWAVGDGYAVGDDPFDEKRKSEDTESTESVYSSDSRSYSRTSYSPSSARAMDRDRYEPSQYGERGYAAADGYERDARSDYYEQSQYGGNQRAYSRDPPAYAPAYQYSGSRNRDQRRSYDDQDLDYVEQITSRNSRGGDTNWVPTAIGAVVGGLLGREVEKKVYEHKDKRERDREDRW